MRYLIFIMLLSVSLLTDAQLNNTGFNKALLEAEFDFWQAHTDSSRFAALLSKVQLYRKAALYSKALNEADRADKYALTAKEKNELKYEQMLDYFLRNDYGYCTTFSFDSGVAIEHSSQIELMRLYALNQTQNWTECKTKMLTYVNKTDSLKRKEIIALPETYTYKDPEKSRRLSSYLPGLGEIYSGYPGKGITSFILTAGFLTFAGYNFYLQYYVTGCLSGLYPVKRFYSGGKRLSVTLANRHNDECANRIKKQYSVEILSIFK